MIIGVDNLHRIKQINNITDTSLAVIELDETTEDYPFKGWSDIKILSYCYEKDVQGFSLYPYIDINVVEKLEDRNREISQLRLEQAKANAELFEMMLMMNGGAL